jgi:hypothetical protein
MITTSRVNWWKILFRPGWSIEFSALPALSLLFQQSNKTQRTEDDEQKRRRLFIFSLVTATNAVDFSHVCLLIALST